MELSKDFQIDQAPGRGGILQMRSNSNSGELFAFPGMTWMFKVNQATGECFPKPEYQGLLIDRVVVVDAIFGCYHKLNKETEEFEFVEVYETYTVPTILIRTWMEKDHDSRNRTDGNKKLKINIWYKDVREHGMLFSSGLRKFTGSFPKGKKHGYVKIWSKCKMRTKFRD